LALVAGTVATPGCSFLRDFDDFSVSDGGVPDMGPDMGPDAAAMDMGPTDLGALDGCTPTMELCNGVDDDCDTMIDESPVATCPLPHVATTTCNLGTCSVNTCATGFSDCTSAPGCETPTSADRNRCGGCNTVCTGEQVCSDSACTVPPVDWNVWFRRATGGSPPITSIEVDSQGRSYVVARADSAFDIEPSAGALTTFPHDNLGYETVVTAINPDGTVAWLARLVGGGHAISATAIDNAGNLVLVGRNSGVVTVRDTAGSVFGIPHTNNSNFQGLVVAFDRDGVYADHAVLGGVGDQFIDGVTTDDDEVFLLGRWTTDLVIGSVDRAPGSMTSGVFVSVLESAFLSHRRTRTIGGELPRDTNLVVDNNDRVYLGGELEEAEPILDGTSLLGSTSVGFWPFIIALNADLSTSWSAIYPDNNLLGAEEAGSFGLAVTGGGTLYLAGSQGSPTTFPIVGPATELGFILKLNGATGDPVGVLSVPGPVVDAELHLGPGGTLLLSGQLVPSTGEDFGTGATPAYGFADLVLVSYRADTFAAQWARTFGGAANDSAPLSAVMPNGDVLLIGEYQGTIALSDGFTATTIGSSNQLLLHVNVP
jgi:hypothetical protein